MAGFLLNNIKLLKRVWPCIFLRINADEIIPLACLYHLAASRLTAKYKHHLNDMTSGAYPEDKRLNLKINEASHRRIQLTANIIILP